MQDRQAEQGAESKDGHNHGIEEKIERKAATKNNIANYWARLVSEQWYMKIQMPKPLLLGVGGGNMLYFQPLGLHMVL